MTEAEKIIREAIFTVLNEEQQYQLALEILHTFHPGMEASHEGHMPWETDEFFEMLERRSKEVQSGQIEPIPGDEVMARLRKLIS